MMTHSAPGKQSIIYTIADSPKASEPRKHKAEATVQNLHLENATSSLPITPPLTSPIIVDLLDPTIDTTYPTTHAE